MRISPILFVILVGMSPSLGFGQDVYTPIDVADIPSLSWGLCDFREAMGISTTYDANSDHYTITIDPFAPGADGIPAVQVPAHGGEFASFQDMDDFYAELIGGFGCSSPPEFPRPDMCNPTNLSFRFNSPIIWMDGSQMASLQDRHPFWGLFTDATGRMAAIQEAIENYWNIDDHACDTTGTTDGTHEWVVTQCSQTQTITEYTYGEEVCGERIGPHAQEVKFARNYFESFTFDGETTSIEEVNGTLWLRIVKADSAELDHHFYNSLTLLDTYLQYRTNTGPFESGEEDRNGACAVGEVKRSGFSDIVMTTMAGGAQNCN